MRMSAPFSVCIFGSVARSNADSVSDKDVLIVSPSGLQLSYEKALWRQRGWSVACYSPSRLERMANAGSLFVQHLKQEGIVLRDDGDKLRSIFSRFTPFNDYRAQISNAFEFARLFERSATTISTHGFFSDVLYFLIRNAGIVTLANQGIYKFSMHEIVQSLARVSSKSFSVSDANSTVSRLRLSKAAYRNGVSADYISPEIIDDGLWLVDRLFGVSIERVSRREVQSWIFADPYLQLRALEKRLIENMSIQDDNLLSTRHSKLLYLKRMISDPRSYSWAIKSDISRIDINAIFQEAAFEHFSPVERRAFRHASLL